MSRVDVIVPCYRYAHFLPTAVNSVLSQSLADVRVLIINDASPDDTDAVARELARADPRVEYVCHPENRGHIATYNEGIEWARADYMMLLSADDYLLPGALERAVSIMDRHPEVGFTYGRALEGDPTTVEEPSAGAPFAWRLVPGPDFLRQSRGTNIVPTPTVVVRTKLQKALGGYEPAFPHAGDMEMWWRFACCAAVGVIDADQAVYRMHSENMHRAHLLGERWNLPDLIERRNVVDSILRRYRHSVPTLEEMALAWKRSIAIEALAMAGEAAQRGRQELSREYADFAAATCPSIRRTSWWAIFLVKRHIDRRLWGTMSRSSPVRWALALMRRDVG